MANNPNVNKVVYDGNTLIDITDTTAVEEDVDTGKVFYKASGARSVGTGSSGSGKMDLVTNPTAGNVLITDANGQAQDAGVEPIYYETVASGVSNVVTSAMDLLWENASPTSYFAEQTVALDLSNYKAVLITFNSGTVVAEVWKYMAVLPVGDSSYYMVFTYRDSYRRRGAYATTGGVYFTAGANNMGNSIPSGTTYNYVCIPSQIYGIR